MIQVRRLSEPAVLVREGDRWTEELCAARRQHYQALSEPEVGRKPKYPRAKTSRYAHREVKSGLEEMFGAKCAYCESRVKAVSYQHVEHFRPQSVYPLLAYEWTNLLLACERCNSAYKRQQFPLIDGSQPQADRADPCSRSDRDDPALIDPCRDDPAAFFDFEGAILVCLDPRAETTRDVCGLNREDLKDERKRKLLAVDIAIKAFQLADRKGSTEDREAFRRYLKKQLLPSESYVAMTRARLAARGIHPDKL